MPSRFTILLLLALPLAGSPRADAGEVRVWSRLAGFCLFLPPASPASAALPGPLVFRRCGAPGGAPAALLRAYAFRSPPASPHRSHSQAKGPEGLRTAGPFFAHYAESELASAVYAETGGLFPRQAKPGSVYDASTWADDFEPGGTHDLRRARRMVAEARKWNKRTHVRPPPAASDVLARRSWAVCEAAAGEVGAHEAFPIEYGERLHFFIRQAGVGVQKPAYLTGVFPVASFGPFVNVGGGDVPAGASTHIDFYLLPAPGW